MCRIARGRSNGTPCRTGYVAATKTKTSVLCLSFFFNDTATTEIYPLSLHAALPISFRLRRHGPGLAAHAGRSGVLGGHFSASSDRKSTRLNSSHLGISYAVFCL